MALDPTGAEIKLGPRSWGRRLSTSGAILHTTEYPTASKAHAAQCIDDQSRRTATGGWAQPGSYNYIVHEEGAYLSVPYLEASGGLAPVPPYWQPGRYPWLAQLLGPVAYGDPTMHHLQIAFSGRTVDLLHALSIGRSWMLDMIDRAARIIVWTEQSEWGNDSLVVSGHMHWQSNRSDPGQPIVDAVVARAVQLSAPPVPTPEPDYRALYEVELGKVTALAERVGAIKRKVAAHAADIADD